MLKTEINKGFRAIDKQQRQEKHRSQQSSPGKGSNGGFMKPFRDGFGLNKKNKQPLPQERRASSQV